MTSWRKAATVWLNDPKRKRVVIGPHGFAWTRADTLYIAVFDEPQDQYVSAYNNFEDGEILEYDKAAVSRSAIIRFVRSGLRPT